MKPQQLRKGEKNTKWCNFVVQNETKKSNSCSEQRRRPRNSCYDLATSAPPAAAEHQAPSAVARDAYRTARMWYEWLAVLAAQAGAHGPILPSRHVNFVDSRVALGAISKGRSSSNRLNAVLRSFLGYEMCAQIYLVLIWIGTHFNPSHDPPNLSR